MNIGYACKLIGVPNTDVKGCTIRNATSARLTELVQGNLNSLNNIIDYNIKNNIKLFRISSDIVPFGSSQINQTKWWDIFSAEFERIGEKIKGSGMRVSMHPGQYTVLNSNNDDIVERAAEDLVYHTKLLDSMGLDSQHKVVLHIGGVYGDKALSADRFVKNYMLLSKNIKKRLVIENDDKLYNIEDVLEIGITQDIPVIFDNLHNIINPAQQNESEAYWIEKCRFTWKKEDGKQKIHYSQQAKTKKSGSHSDSIGIDEFMDFYRMIGRQDLDIMLEVKDKNLSCIKCVNCTTPNLNIRKLEEEWGRYKYTMLEKSHSSYLKIRQFLKVKQNFSPVAFYQLLEDGMQGKADLGSCENTALHVWGYFKNIATEKERETFYKYLEKFKLQQIGIGTLKNYLQRLSEKYNQEYLLKSYYFSIQ